MVFDVGLSTVLGCEPEEVSFWHTLFYIQSAGSLEALIETESGAQAYKFTQGAKVLVEKLAEGVSWEVERPVRQVTYGPHGVKLKAGDRHYSAKHLYCSGAAGGFEPDCIGATLTASASAAGSAPADGFGHESRSHLR